MNIRVLPLLLLIDLVFIDILNPKSNNNNSILKFNTLLNYYLYLICLNLFILIILIIIEFEVLIVIEIELVTVPILDTIVALPLEFIEVIFPLINYSVFYFN